MEIRTPIPVVRDEVTPAFAPLARKLENIAPPPVLSRQLAAPGVPTVKVGTDDR